ncbi:MAG: hypothetical protein KatS3mg129_1500 [Leptospiraceae bacterium]|nr:MAG: hypothetical protein KatS3mg129_1500 [Leptospiraceae bacterium]
MQVFFKRNLNYGIVFILLFMIFTGNSCYLHYAKIEGDLFGLKNGKKIQEFNTYPVQVEINFLDSEEIKKILLQMGTSKTVLETQQDAIESYRSLEIRNQFLKSRIFNFDPNSNIRIVVKSNVNELRPGGISYVANLGTLGLFPAVHNTFGTIVFEVYDVENDKLLKVYKYPVEHTYFVSWFSAILAPVFQIFSDRFDQSTTSKTFAIMRVAYKQFEQDFIKEAENNSSFKERIYTNPYNYAIIPVEKKDEVIKQIQNTIIPDLSEAFNRSNYKLIERKHIDKILQEIKFSQSGFTDNTRLRLGQLLEADRLILVDFGNTNLTKNQFFGSISYNGILEINLKCIEVNTGKIIWSYSYYNKLQNLNENDLMDLLNNPDTGISQEIMKNLRFKGIIL